MNNEVVFLKDKLIRIDKDVIMEMKSMAGRNSSGKFRYCLHESESAGMQEMIFVISDTVYARPHMHRNAAETQIVLDGEGYCVLFDRSGNITETFNISPCDNFIYRIQREVYHMVISISEKMVLYEVREGTFNIDTNIFPKWAPKEEEVEKVRQYRKWLLRQLGDQL